MSVPIEAAIEMISSVSVIDRMLPNRKLKRSTLNPPARLAIITPPAIPMEERIPIAASASAVVFLVIKRMMIDPRTPIGRATQNGERLRSSPKASAPKVTCARPSPIRAMFLRTRKTPRIAQVTARKRPPMSAFWMN